MTCGVMESPRFYDMLLLLGKALISLFTVLLSSRPVVVAVLTVLVTVVMAVGAFWSRPYYNKKVNRVLNGTSWGVVWVHIVALIGTCDSDLLSTASVSVFAAILVVVVMAGFQAGHWDEPSSWCPLPWQGTTSHSSQVHPEDSDNGNQAATPAVSTDDTSAQPEEAQVESPQPQKKSTGV